MTQGMYNIVMEIATGLAVLCVIILAFRLRRSRKIISSLIIAALPKPQNETEIIREDFLKFVSDSREWAFEYIEEFQSGLNVFVKEVGPLVEYFDKYGSIGPEGPDKEALKKISLAYKELIKLLPEGN